MAGKNERQRRQAREKYRRQQELRFAKQRQVRKRWLTGLSAVLAAGLVAALVVVFLPSGGAKKPAASASKSPSASASASATTSAATVAEPAHHCAYTKATPVSKNVGLPPATPDYTGSYQATIKTNLGPITVSLLNSKATCTVNSFIHLAQTGYFNNTQCHRLLTSGIYVLQCGDAYATAGTKLNCSTTSTVGTGTPGYEYASENLTNAKYPAGTVAMANGGTATSNGSQFFIVYKDSSTGLGTSYTPFATVSSGLNIIQNVAKGGTSCTYPQAGGGVPKEKVIIDNVTIKKT
ncbi:MAG TPA: peptidylprolyl isomerase [Streptosporangiaceae bacterium]|nr:peptidylprolyl isomerase [Streptosporangiaceae bacterium]